MKNALQKGRKFCCIEFIEFPIGKSELRPLGFWDKTIFSRNYTPLNKPLLLYHWVLVDKNQVNMQPELYQLDFFRPTKSYGWESQVVIHHKMEMTHTELVITGPESTNKLYGPLCHQKIRMHLMCTIWFVNTGIHFTKGHISKFYVSYG